MSERKRGGLDYTPRAFPGARDPDGPAPDLESKLAQPGLLEGAERIDVGANDRPVDAGTDTKPSAKKRASLDYTPRAFPGARDPDGPAPGIEERLAKSGWVQPAETGIVPPGARPDTRPAARPDIRPAASVAQPQMRRERPAPPASEAGTPAPRVREPAPAVTRAPSGSTTPPPAAE